MTHPYGKYFQKIYGKWKPFEQSRWKYYPCPGCMMHKEIVGEQRGKILFRKYCNKYPQSAYKLYWNSHPVEYKKLLDICNSRRYK